MDPKKTGKISKEPDGCWQVMLDRLQEILNGRLHPFPAETNSPEELAIKDFYQDLVNKTFKITIK